MTKASAGFYIGIDSGGTKCELLIVSESKKILFRKIYKGVHYSVSGPAIYSNSLAGFISDALIKSKRSLKDCKCICFGIAGAREGKDRKNLRLLFQDKLKFKKLIITTDAMTALFGAFEGGDGIILISGTGSVLYGYSNGKITRVGGWGRIIGDEGSGYWIGKSALNVLAKEIDKRNFDGALYKTINKKFGLTRENLNEKTFNKNFEIQKLAPAVIKLAENGNNLCRKIIDSAVEGLSYLIKTFLKISGRKKPIKIAFIGSVIENENILSLKLKKEISKLKIVRIVKKKYSSAYGAVLLAMEDPALINKL